MFAWWRRLAICASSTNMRASASSVSSSMRLSATRRSKPPSPSATASKTSAIPPRAMARTIR